MQFTLIGPSLYTNERGKLYLEKEGGYEPLRTEETEAEDRYVERHLGKGGIHNEED